MSDNNEQIVEIRPAGRWLSLNLKELWSYRELLYFLTLRDIKVRYKQTAIGIVWAVLQPVLTTAVFSVIFSTFAKFETADIPYPLFALSGLMLWLFVHNSITAAAGSFVNNTNLVTKVYFPRLIVPISATLAGMLDLLISFVILVFLMALYRTGVFWTILAAPAFVFMAVVVAAAFGTLFSALNVRYRDVKFALPFVIQIWMIASPIFYPVSIVPAKWQYIFAVNPLTGILDGFRSALFGLDFNWPLIAISAVSTLILAGISIAVFKRMEDDFADMI